MRETNFFSKGIRDGLPICLGYLSVAFAFGIFAVANGLTGVEAVLGFLTAMFLAWRGKGLLTVALSSCAVALLTELVLK